MPCETHSSYEGGKNDKRRERNEAREEEKKKQCGVKKMKTEWNETLLMCTNTASSENTGTGEKEIRWGWEWKVTAVQIRAHYNNVHCVLELDFEMKFSTTNTIAISPHFHKKCTHKAAYLIIQSSWLIKRQEMEEKVPEVWHVPPAVCHTPWSQTPLASSWTQSPPWHGTVLSNKWMMLWSKISNILLP